MQEKFKTVSITALLILGAFIMLGSVTMLKPCHAQPSSKAHYLQATQPVTNATGVPVDDDDAPDHWADPHYRMEATKQMTGIVVFLTIVAVITYRRRHVSFIRSHSSHA